MKYVLDTDHISILQQHTSPEYSVVKTHLARHSRSDIAFSIVSFHEQVLGCHTYIVRARRTAEIVRGYAMLSRVIGDYGIANIVTFDTSAGAIFDSLIGRRLRTPTMDLRIAAIALANRLILVSRNSRHFAQVPGLVIEDWTK